MSTDKKQRPDSESFHALAERGAPLADRLLAFAFDLCLWSPMALLLGKPFWRDFQYHQAMNAGSNEAILNFGFGLSTALVFLLSVHTILVWRFGTTPGKKIFMLDVVHINGGRLTLGQSFTRAVTQIFEILCFIIPAFEIVSHPERRPWHDRLAESRVITRKPLKFEAPHALESRFFRNLYWGFGLSVFVFAFAGLTQLRHQVKLGAFQRAELEKNEYLCANKTKIPAHSGMTKAQARIDFVLAQFEAGVADQECVEAEADFAIWTQSEETMPWAHLIRGVIASKTGADTTEDGPAKQFALACPEPNVDAKPPGRGLASLTETDADVRCELARYYQGDEHAELTDRTWTGQILQLKQALAKGEFEEIGTIAVKNPWPLELSSFVQEIGLKALALKGDDNAFRAGMKLLAPGWTEEKRFGAMAWACFAAITKTCQSGGESPTICRALRTELETASNDAWTPEIAMTFQLESRCHNRKDVVAETQAKAKLGSDEETGWALELGKAQLKDLQSIAQDHWARPYLLWWVSRNAKAVGEELALEFQRGRRSQPDWWLAYQAFDEASIPKSVPQLVPAQSPHRIPANAEGAGE